MKLKSKKWAAPNYSGNTQLQAYNLFILFFYSFLKKVSAVKKSLLRLISYTVIDEFMTLYLLVNRDLFGENIY